MSTVISLYERTRPRPARTPKVRQPGIGLYVHIPFCAARCPYCDFATAPATSPLRARYVETLAREIRLQGARLGRQRVRTLYFGGGTPSLLEPQELALLQRALRAAFELRPVEVTLEANPATLEPRRLDAFVAAGVTRVSLGAQSLDPAGLRALARTHRVEEVARSVEAVRAAGVRDLNLDLIFGWPGETREAWRMDLARAVALGPDHLSCYPLTLAHEPEDAVANWPGGGWSTLARWRGRAAAAQPPEDVLADMYLDAEKALAAEGFVHYEIANWAKPGHRCRHNLLYWRDGEWLGVGVGAHSHLVGRRFWNSGRLAEYLERWAAGGEPSDDPRSAIAAEPWESAMLALRLREGLAFARFAERHGRAALEEVVARLRTLDGSGLLRWRSTGVALTRRGRLLSNEVFVRLLPAAARASSDCEFAANALCNDPNAT